MTLGQIVSLLTFLYNMHIRQACEAEMEAWEQSPDSPGSQAAFGVLWEGWSSGENLLAIDFVLLTYPFALSRPSELKVSL